MYGDGAVERNGKKQQSQCRECKVNVMDDSNNQRLVVTPMPPAILPGDPPEPCPELLTPSEAIRYLRLDVNGPKNPELTLRRYREIGVLRGTVVGRRILYRRVEIERFLQKKTLKGSELA